MEPGNSARNMLIAGIIMVLLNLAALGPMSTGAVPDAVEENFATFPLDQACDDGDCSEAEDDWASSTAQRDFFAWSVTNLDDVMATNADPTYEKVGPFTYDITTTRTIVDHDEDAGTLTYTSSNSFACADDSEVSCDTEVTQLNIAFQTQVIGATGLAIEGIMDTTKLAFTTGMLANDLENGAPAAAVAAGTAGGLAQMGGINAMTTAGMGAAYYDAFDAYFAASNLSGMGTSVNYTMATMNANASDVHMFADLTTAFESAMMPTGENVSLTSSLGVLAFAGHCDSYATATYDEVMADAANGFANIGTMQRATIWGYMAMASQTMPDVNTTIARDHALCFGIGGGFLQAGGANEMWMMDAMSANASTRLHHLGIHDGSMTNAVAMNLLTNGTGTDMPMGLLASNEAGTSYGVGAFLSMEAADAIAMYGLTPDQYTAVAMWAGAWFTDGASVPMFLLGGEGTMTASQFVNISFGAEDPLNGGYLTNSLNLGGAWQLLGASGGEAVNLNASQSGNALYGPLGLTTSTGASIFLYGELSGMTPPIDFTTMGPGTPMDWNEQTIAALYGVDTNAAAAMRALMMGPIYGTTSSSFVPGYLMSTFGTTPYLTQSVNAWLLGWHDPVSAYLATGNPMDMSVGWASLETNETYFGSNGISTGNATQYTICTGEVDTCDKGETLLVDGSEQLSWRNDAVYAGTFGLITPESLVGTTGGFLTGTGDKVDVSGYAIADVTSSGEGTVKGIPVNTYTATVDPVQRNIQAKLLGTGTLLDATPGALPVYFGSNIEMSAEELSGLIIAGSSESTFYLDTREHTDQASTPALEDLTPVFQIMSSSTIADDDAEEMESSIVQNQDSMLYWTNFDVPTDFLVALFWILGLVFIAMGVMKVASTPADDEGKAYTAAEDTASDEAAESTE